MTRQESECWDSAQRWHEKYLKAEAEIERLTAERANRYWEGRWRDEKADNERLRAAISYVRMRSAHACEVLNEFDNTRRALEPKP